MVDDKAIEEMFEWIHNEPDLGKVDLCIPNAGLATKSNLMEGTVKEWRQMLDVNVISLTLCTQLSLKSMIKVHKNLILTLIVFPCRCAFYKVKKIFRQNILLLLESSTI